jgi:hypothetical protein
MSTDVNICFDVPDKGGCDKMYDYLAEHPNDVRDYEKRVEQSFHDQGFDTSFLHEARWSSGIVLSRGGRGACAAITRNKI